MQVHMAHGFRKTGRILQRLLDEHSAAMGGHVGWGVTVDRASTPCLNANAGALDKLQQAEKLEAAGVGVKIIPTHQDEWVFPLIGRRRQHTGGADIQVILDRYDLAQRLPASDYFTAYVPSVAEYRVWIYRRRHLATYKKVLENPRRATGFGRNYDNGWVFKLVPRLNRIRQITDASAKAVDTLGLDFGAVDVLLTPEDRAVVLEVNTAPGIESESRAGIRNLAEKMIRWHDLGFPRRSGDDSPR